MTSRPMDLPTEQLPASRLHRAHARKPAPGHACQMSGRKPGIPTARISPPSRLGDGPSPQSRLRCGVADNPAMRIRTRRGQPESSLRYRLDDRADHCRGKSCRTTATGLYRGDSQTVRRSCQHGPSSAANGRSRPGVLVLLGLSVCIPNCFQIRVVKYLSLLGG